MKRFIPLGCALAIVLAACAGSRSEIADEFLPDTGPTTSTVSGTAPSTSTATTLALDVEAQIAVLVERVREIRQTPLVSPTIEYRAATEVDAGYRALHGLARTGDERFDDAYLRMLGVLEAGQSITDLENVCAVPGFYDPASGNLVMAEGLSELTPLGRRHLVAELTAAATDAAHGWGSTMAAQLRSGEVESAVALAALVQGDAAFHADQYVEQDLTSTDRFAITLEQIACERERVPPPGYVSELEAFGPDVGRTFVEDLISNGGVVAVDAAYRNRPTSSEQIYHPARFAAGEAAVEVGLPRLSASGFTEVDNGVFGERQFRALLSEGVTSAQALQAATGWGGDSFRLLWDGSDVVLVLLFEGDEARDARELAETLGGWASAAMRVGSGRPDNSGLAFEGEEYAFVAHDDTAMLLVLSSDAKAGRDVRNIFWPQW